MNADTLIQMGGTIAAHLQSLTVEEQVRVLNEVRSALHTAGPFSNEPVDATYWVLGEQVVGNPYNPNAVAPPEMRLLEHSIRMDGYTQPIVGWGRDGVVEVVDGFHRHRVGREVEDIRTRLPEEVQIFLRVQIELRARRGRLSLLPTKVSLLLTLLGTR